MKPTITFDKKSFSIVLDTMQKNIISSFLIMCAFSVINILLFFSHVQSMVLTMTFAVLMPPSWIAYICITSIQKYKGVFVFRITEKDPAILQLITREDVLKEEITLCEEKIFRLEHHMIKEATLPEFRENTGIDQRREDKKNLTELNNKRKLLLSELEELGVNYIQTLEAKTA